MYSSFIAIFLSLSGQTFVWGYSSKLLYYLKILLSICKFYQSNYYIKERFTIMGLLDWITKTQDKLISLQKRIVSASFDEFFKREKKKQQSATPKPKQHSKTSRPVISAADQTIAQRDSFIRNGFKEYTFIANRDCCNECGELNGKRFSVKKLQIGVNAPPMHEGCRCSISAYTDRREYEEWLNHLSKGGTTKGFEKKKRKR